MSGRLHREVDGAWLACIATTAGVAVRAAVAVVVDVGRIEREPRLVTDRGGNA